MKVWRYQVVCAMALFIRLTAPGWSDPPDPAAAPTDESPRPDWIVGYWVGSHMLNLDPDGSYALMFLATLSGQPDKWLGKAGGAGGWSLEPSPDEPGWHLLRVVEKPYALRRGHEADKLLIRDPLTGDEVPFYRVDKGLKESISEASSLMHDLKHGKVRGDERIESAARALRLIRALPAPPPSLVADASFLLARALDADQRYPEAMDFYDEAVDLRAQVYESPHVDLTRAFFFGGRCAEQVAGYDKALWYLARATLNQHAVLERLEQRADLPPNLLQAAQAETTAVYLQLARFLSDANGTMLVVELFPAAIRTAQAAGDRAAARAGAAELFNHLLARPTLHRHPQLLFWAYRRIAESEAGDRVYRKQVGGQILGEVRIARELMGMSPAYPELAERVALRAVALSRLAGPILPAYVQASMIPDLVDELTLANRTIEIPDPPDGFWPVEERWIDRRKVDQALDSVAPPVDLAEAFPDWDLDAEQPPATDPTLHETLAQLRDQLPNLLDLADRAAGDTRTTRIGGWLADHESAAP